MTPEDKGYCWLSIYSAMIAAQVVAWVHEGRGAPSGDVMVRFIEEAAAVADLHHETEFKDAQNFHNRAQL